MKRLLTILGTMGIVATPVTTLVGCYKKEMTEVEKESQLQEDLQVLEDINLEINTYLTQNSYQQDLELNNDYLYSLVNKTAKDNQYHLDFTKEKDKKAIDKIFYSFRVIATNINQQIKNKYSNYYKNSDPFNIDVNNVEMTIRFIDLEAISGIKGENNVTYSNENIKAVAVDFTFKYKISYKSLEKETSFTTNFNVTNNLNGFEKIKKGVINYFNQIIAPFFMSKQLVNITDDGFKTLYDQFKIDFKESKNEVNNVFATLLKKFINDNNINGITYNKGSFINLNTNLFLNKKDLGYFYNDSVMREKEELKQWLKKDEKEEVLIQNFIQTIKTEIVPKLNGTVVTLGSFTFNLNYLNIYGLTLKGIFQRNNSDFISQIKINAENINNKLTQFIKNILLFLNYFEVIKYFNADPKAIKTFKVSEQLWNKLIKALEEKKLATNSLPGYLWDAFKANNNVDENSFQFKADEGWKNYRLESNDTTIYFVGGGYGAKFVFSNLLQYMPFYYWFASGRYQIIK